MFINVLLNAYFVLFVYFAQYVFIIKLNIDSKAHSHKYGMLVLVLMSTHTLPFRAGIRVEHVVCPKWEWDASTDA